ncbi:MAG: TIGR03618 family F420-dependent PPOX class oxidoreductase [Acidimicrobiaceae bacterium]|nr:TIGR03618 family F420-dependent PPOX class oxidoreductase [Acidimicrobiaceae bacterium]
MPTTTNPTVPLSHRDLLDAYVAALATNGLSGKPQVTAIGFYYDKVDDQVKISLNDARQKTKNMRRDPQATLFILDLANPQRSLEIRAGVELRPDPDLEFCRTAGAKYGVDFHDHDLPGETRSIVVLHPTRILATSVGEHGMQVVAG